MVLCMHGITYNLLSKGVPIPVLADTYKAIYIYLRTNTVVFSLMNYYAILTNKVSTKRCYRIRGNFRGSYILWKTSL